MADTTVKHFHSGMSGAPALSGTIGSLIGLLDACLVNGFGTITLDSLVIAGGVATATRAAGHPFEVDAVIAVAGATVSGGTINGEQRITAVTTTTFQFPVTGLADQTATGTITTKFAPVGWAKPFSGTNLAVYRSQDVTGTQLYLRIDDTNATSARAVGYETMSDINTGTGAFPTALQQSGGLFWTKSNTADSTTRTWELLGDGRIFYLNIAHYSTSGTYAFAYVFGDIISKKSPDAYACIINGGNVAQGNNSNSNELFYSATSVQPQVFMARSYTALGSSVTVLKTNDIRMGGGGGSGTGGLDYPNATDNGLYVIPMYVIEDATFQVLRGILPGVYYCPMGGLNAGGIAHKDKIEGVTGLSGRKLWASYGGAGYNRTGFFEISGPWR